MKTNVVEMPDRRVHQMHRRSDPDTSRLAAAKHPDLKSLQLRVLDIITRAGPRGLTDYEISVAFGVTSTSTARTRRSELEQAGLIRFTGLKRRVEGSLRQVYALAEHVPDDAPHLATRTKAKPKDASALDAIVRSFLDEHKIASTGQVMNVVAAKRLDTVNFISRLAREAGFYVAPPPEPKAAKKDGSNA